MLRSAMPVPRATARRGSSLTWTGNFVLMLIRDVQEQAPRELQALVHVEGVVQVRVVHVHGRSSGGTWRAAVRAWPSIRQVYSAMPPSVTT